MGLNMNYRFFLESSNDNIKRHNYERSDKIGYSEVQLMRYISEFNQILRSTMNDIKYIQESIDVESELPSTASVALINSLKEKFDMVCTAIQSITDKVLNSIDATISYLKSIHRDDKHSFAKAEVIRNALLYHGSISMSIGNVSLSRPIRDKNYPDLSLLNAPLINFIKDAIGNYCIDSDSNSISTDLLIGNSELGGSESFVDFINNNTDSLLSGLFKDFDYDKTSVTNTSMRYAEKLFGNVNKQTSELSYEIYARACSNIENIDTIIAMLEENKLIIQEAYKNVLNEISSIRTSILNSDKTFAKMNNGSVYDILINSFTGRLSRIINVIQEIYNAEFVILNHKLSIINSIYKDSVAIRNSVDELLNEFVSNSRLDAAAKVNGANITQEFYDLSDKFEMLGYLIDEFFNDREYYRNNVMLLFEEEGTSPTPVNNGNTQTTTTTTSNNTGSSGGNNNDKARTGSGIKAWLGNTFGNLGKTFQRFSNRIAEIITTKSNKKWWNDNKDRIKSNPPMDTTVNEWYDYKTDLIEKSSFIKFDNVIATDDLSKDENFQNKIISTITSTPPQFEENDSFGQKLRKIYQGNFTNDENGKGVPLKNTGFNFDGCWNYVDDMTNRGMGGKALGSISEDYKKIDTEFKRITGDYSRLSREYKSTNNTPENKTTQTVQKTETKASEPQQSGGNNGNVSGKQESVLSDCNNNRFDLAEHFGLMNNRVLNVERIHEVSVTPGENDKKMNSNTQSGNESDDKYAEFDNKVKTYFRVANTAITARMTAALAAYKEYIALFGSIYGKPANTEEKKEEENK